MPLTSVQTVTRYHIHTEYWDGLWALVDTYFECFAILQGEGWWRGLQEKAAIVDIIATNPEQEQLVVRLADNIREANNQEAVYVTVTKVDLLDFRAPVVSVAA